MTPAASRTACLPWTIAIATACLLPAARAAEVTPIAWPPAHAGDHVRYRLRECGTSRRDDAPPAASVPAPRCRDRAIALTVLAVDADGRARVRWITTGPAADPGVAALEQGDLLPRRVFAQGVPLELAIGADGAPAVVDAASFRALVKRFAEGLAAEPAHADAAQVQRIVEHLEALSDLELTDAVTNDAKILYAARSRPLVPASTLDDVQAFQADLLPVPIEMDRHIAVSALSADGQGIQQTTTALLNQAHAAALTETMIEKMHARGLLSTPAEQAQAREVLASPMPMRSTIVTTIDLRNPWPTRISQVFETHVMHVESRWEQTWTRE